VSLFLRITLLIGAVLLSFGCRTVSRMEELVMGSIPARITVVSTRMSSEEVESAVQAAFAEVHKVDRLMSKYKKDSDVSRLNGSGAGVWVQVDRMTFSVLDESQKIAELTGGAFDATALPLSTLWGFWPAKEPLVPPDEEIRNVLSHVGYQKLSLNRSTFSLMKSDPETKVDLGGIAKGYAVDRAIEILRRRGVRDALVEVGGETRAIGRNKDAKPWRIGVLHPSRRGYLTILELLNRAVATSGDYMKFFVVEEKTYSHLIDPRTGSPISNDVCSVTVIADNCTEADALATAISALGTQDGLKLIESLPAAEAIIARRVGEEERIEVRVSSGLKGVKLAQ